MRFLILAAFSVIACFGAERPRAPKAQDVALADGRLIEKVGSVFISGDVIELVSATMDDTGAPKISSEKVARSQVPAEFLLQWQTYHDALKREREEKQVAARAQAEKDQKERAERRAAFRPTSSAVDSAGREAIERAQREVDELAKRPEREARAREAKENARLADLARSPRGLFIVGFSPYTDGSGLAEVILVNRDTSPRKLEAAELLGVQGDTDKIVAAGDVVFRVEERADLWLMPGQQRQFRVRFPEGRAIAGLSWSIESTDWRTPGNPAPAVASAQDAAREFREKRTAERIAERARKVGR